MRLLAAVAVMSVMLVLGAEASECLDRSASQITVVPPGTYTTRFREDAPADFHTFDMRGAEWRMDVRPDGKPVGVYQHLKGACISGAAVVGMQPRDASWDDVKNSDGPRFVYESGATVGHMTVEGVYVDNVGDGFEPARYSNSAGLGYSWSLRSSYFRWIRDDVIENDACHAGEVVDVLVDESFTFISTRPGSGNDLNTGAMPPVIKVHDTLVHIGSLPGGAGRLWKWPGSSSSCTPEPILDVRNSIFRVDVEAGTMDFPEGTYQNVTVVWTGDGSFPVAVPSGVTVTTDIGIWDAARSDWLERHGCDENGDFCDGLLEPVDDPTPDPGPEPDPEPDTAPIKN